MSILAVGDMLTARVHALAEDGEIPVAGSTWFTPKKIEYSRLVEMTAKSGVDIVDFLTVKILGYRRSHLAYWAPQISWMPGHRSSGKLPVLIVMTDLLAYQTPTRL